MFFNIYLTIVKITLIFLLFFQINICVFKKNVVTLCPKRVCGVNSLLKKCDLSPLFSTLC